MKYVALLRGINVGGKARVEMPKLKLTFEGLGFTDVVTYINSGNVIFQAQLQTPHELTKLIEAAIQSDFGFTVPVLIRDQPTINFMCEQIPADWVNDPTTMRTDVMFLWEHVDEPGVVKQFIIRPAIENLLYVKGALVWNIGREHVRQGAIIKIIGTDLYKSMTIRNINTVRKLAALMAESAA